MDTQVQRKNPPALITVGMALLVLGLAFTQQHILTSTISAGMVVVGIGCIVVWFVRRN